jgi:hypothetical protein
VKDPGEMPGCEGKSRCDTSIISSMTKPDISLQFLSHLGDSFVRSQGLHSSSFLLTTQYKIIFVFHDPSFDFFSDSGFESNGCSPSCKHLFHDFSLSATSQCSYGFQRPAGLFVAGAKLLPAA